MDENLDSDSSVSDLFADDSDAGGERWWGLNVRSQSELLFSPELEILRVATLVFLVFYYVEVVKKKIDSLLSQYRREKKIAESKSDMGLDEKKTHLQPQQEVIEDSYQQEDMIEDEKEGEEQVKVPSALKEGSTRDALSIYGENIASRLKNIRNRRRQLILINKIDNLLFEAEIEEEDEISYTRSSSSRASATTDPGLLLHHHPLDAGEGTHSQPSYTTYTQLWF
ncbi:hypothetical protein J6590_094361 [Homalodisca vitripennis]|nr:hypothetical protein J6590_094361 [Homalodisca vitripennis]